MVDIIHHVTCSESVRLVDGAGLCSGRVEVKSNQSWASVCEADFDRQDAEGVCGELGCGAPAALQGGLYGGGDGQTWDKEFKCKGKESLLLDCDTSDRKHNTCLPGNAVGLTCSEPDDVRLVGGGSRCAGGVEWYDQGEWRTVGADWNQEDVAAVVCRQLGCDSTVSVPPGNTTRGFGVQCYGSESSLRECSRSYYLLPGLTVICSDLLVQPDISLTDSMGGAPGATRGRVFGVQLHHHLLHSATVPRRLLPPHVHRLQQNPDPASYFPQIYVMMISPLIKGVSVGSLSSASLS
nr:scavenger receptor cysteine-rich type 1 protein M130 [Salvelinus alpinus]